MASRWAGLSGLLIIYIVLFLTNLLAFFFIFVEF